jgi:hypothetical protein
MQYAVCQSERVLVATEPAPASMRQKAFGYGPQRSKKPLPNR